MNLTRIPSRSTSRSKTNFLSFYVKAFQSYRITDRHTDIHRCHQNTSPRSFAGDKMHRRIVSRAPDKVRQQEIDIKRRLQLTNYTVVGTEARTAPHSDKPFTPDTGLRVRCIYTVARNCTAANNASLCMSPISRSWGLGWGGGLSGAWVLRPATDWHENAGTVLRQATGGTSTAWTWLSPPSYSPTPSVKQQSDTFTLAS